MSTRRDPEREMHKAWLGLLQPVGLVVAPPALIKAQVVLDKNTSDTQAALLNSTERPASITGEADPEIRDFPRFAEQVLGWSLEDIAGAPGGPPLPESLEVALPEYGDVLRPTYAVLDGMAEGKLLLLVSVTEPGVDMDAPPTEAHRGWNASPQARLERLLRQSGVPAGLLCNAQQIRLVYAPSGETSGHLSFPVAEMCTVGGRLILGALHMLLSEPRVFGAPEGQRLLDILAESRKYQSEVSNKLSEQVLNSLWELLRGLQAADEAANGRVLYELRRTAPEQIYGGTLTVIMRMVFLLYAEDQGLMPDDPVYASNYSISGLYERLREDAGRYPDTMDQRYGAWSWLLSTFRLIFDGGSHAGLRLPARHGQLFNPDEYPFLEGRPPGVNRVMGATFDAPKVADGVVWRVLEDLLVLDGERVSYRALDVEQIGSVYEAMMGFEVRSTEGRSIALRPKRVVINLDRLLQEPGGKRAAWLKSQAECEVTGKAAIELKAAKTVEDLVAALARRIAQQTPQVLPPGALFLQPGEERRRSGSHYTPRELTEPIVRTTLKPVLAGLGSRPKPEQILDLKVCDPAMGSGAFLVESCRQLAEALVEAWTLHDCVPAIPPDEEPLLHARRLVAQRCLYGVDKNPFAVNLATLSLWLVTLARDHAFTFLDHALKHGDSLVGLTQEQIGAFHWDPPKQDWGPLFDGVAASITKADAWRKRIQMLDDGAYDERREAWREAEDELHEARFVGDLCIAAFFGADKPKDRETLRKHYNARLDEWKAGRVDLGELREAVDELRGGERPVTPFHWEIEFPEVFGRESHGFDALVGNPPFLGGSRLSTVLGAPHEAFLKAAWPALIGKIDLVLFFLHKGAALIRSTGSLALVTTYRIADGANALVGLAPFTRNDWMIYWALKERQWPGEAKTRISQLAIRRRVPSASATLEGRSVEHISCDLRSSVDLSAAQDLSANADLSFLGAKPDSLGFLLSDEEQERIAQNCPTESAVMKRYLIGNDVTKRPHSDGSRWIIDFSAVDEESAKRDFPFCFAVVFERVRPGRMKLKRAAYRERWWQYTEPQLRAHSAARELDRERRGSLHCTDAD